MGGNLGSPLVMCGPNPQVSKLIIPQPVTPRGDVSGIAASWKEREGASG